MNGSTIELIGLIAAVAAFLALVVFGGMVWSGKHIGPILPPFKLPQQSDAEVSARLERLHERQAEVWKHAWLPLVLLLVMGIVFVVFGVLQS